MITLLWTLFYTLIFSSLGYWLVKAGQAVHNASITEWIDDRSSTN